VLRSHGMEIRECHGPLASLEGTRRQIASGDIAYIMGAGHGLEDVFQGDMWEVLFQVGEYPSDHVRGRIVHLTSCLTGRELGPDFVQNGCTAFFGYKERFFIPGIAGFREALECDGEIDLAFAQGNTAEEVYQRVMRKYDELTERLARAGEYEAEAYLEDNRDSLCAPSVGSQWGNREAKLVVPVGE